MSPPSPLHPVSTACCLCVYRDQIAFDSDIGLGFTISKRPLKGLSVRQSLIPGTREAGLKKAQEQFNQWSTVVRPQKSIVETWIHDTI